MRVCAARNISSSHFSLPVKVTCADLQTWVVFPPDSLQDRIADAWKDYLEANRTRNTADGQEVVLRPLRLRHLVLASTELLDEDTGVIAKVAPELRSLHISSHQVCIRAIEQLVLESAFDSWPVFEHTYPRLNSVIFEDRRFALP